jgi:hypothetical protein
MLAEDSSGSSITVGLKVVHDGAEQPTLVVRGHRTTSSPLGKFKISANVAHIPCAGEYRFEAAQENTENGNSLAYGAQITLSDVQAQPPGSDCGVAPPPRPGALEVALEIGNQRPFFLHASRAGKGLFAGTLSFTKFPECNRTYRLETRLDLAGWNRAYSFDARVGEIDVSMPGHEPNASPC